MTSLTTGMNRSSFGLTAVSASTNAVAREWIERQVGTGPRDTKAQSRQIGAKWHGPKLRSMVVPALVLAGDEDPIVKLKAGQDTAKRIPTHGSRSSS